MAQPPQEWFFNTPVLWLAAVVLIGLLRGPLRNAPAILKKLVKFVVASLISFGMVILLMSEPIRAQAKLNTTLNLVWLLLVELSIVGWIASFFRIMLSRQKRKPALSVAGSPAPRPAAQPVTIVRNVPVERFADVGGMEDTKEQIRHVVLGHLQPGKYESQRSPVSRLPIPCRPYS